MVTYSIRDLEKLSGIKAHTIRIWEQRYHIIEPKRTPTNIRYYTDEDLKCLLNIAFLNKNGVRISQIARMNREEIGKQVENISLQNTEDSNQLQTLTMAMVELDEHKAEQVLNTAISQSGFEHVAQTLIIPFLEKLSLLWITGSISTVHEQFVHCILRQKLLVATEQLPRRVLYHKRFLLYLPKGDNHDLEVALLIGQYLLRKYGFEVTYLGVGMSIQDLLLAYNIHKPDYFYTILSESRIKHGLHDYVTKLTQTFPATKFLIACHNDCDINPANYSASIQMVENFDAAIDLFEALAQEE